MKIRGWPSPEALVKDKASDRPWNQFLPAFPIVRPYRRRRRPSAPRLAAGGGHPQTPAQLELGLVVPATPPPPPPARRLSQTKLNRLAFDRFRFSLPKPVASLLEKFESHQWHLLRLVDAFEERALQLGTSRPAIAYLLALEFARGFRSHASINDLLGLRQRDLIGELGFPAENPMVKVLERIHPASLDPRQARLLRRAASVPDVRSTLVHLPEIHAGILAFLESRAIWSRATNRLLIEVAEDKVERHRITTARRLSEIVTIERELGRNPQPRQFQSRQRITETHNELLRLREQQRIRAASRRRVAARRFPQPPIPGTPAIIPLTSAQALEEEGHQQDNCVGCYAEAVRSGRCYIYRILTPERCTLSIRPSTAGNWEIAELETAGNHPASKSTHRTIEKWLGAYRIGA